MGIRQPYARQTIHPLPLDRCPCRKPHPLDEFRTPSIATVGTCKNVVKCRPMWATRDRLVWATRDRLVWATRDRLVWATRDRLVWATRDRVMWATRDCCVWPTPVRLDAFAGAKCGGVFHSLWDDVTAGETVLIPDRSFLRLCCR